ncbi:type IV pilus secretin PilQ [Macromonas bipunctata]|uniref:type IV pilus secretin PilQ n=1 Tax=Macromonas bipunctata TaxID=183670 RepID=UPI000C3300FB|nr:type IV pilus secretin PilQ [Macromonas bipunctata]
MTHVWQKPGAQQRHWSRTLAVPALLAALWTAGLAHAQLAIRAVSVSTQAGSEVVRIETSEPLAQLPAGFVIQQPARIALDFAGATNPLALGQIALNQGNVRSAQVVEAAGRTRVVLNLNQAAQYRTELDGNALLVWLEPNASAARSASPLEVALGSARGSFAEGTAADVRPLSDVDFRLGSNKTGRVVVGLASSQVGVDIRQQGKQLVVEFAKTSLPEGMRRRLDVTDFGTPVQAITTTQIGDRVRMVIDAQGAWEHSAYQSDNQLVLEVREPKTDPNKLSQGPGYTGEKLSLNFQSIDVRSLLQVIADFTNFNIVTSESVTGNLTLRLKDVPWDQALDIILQAKGLGMRKVGNVIRVAPKDELAAREKMDYEAAAQVELLEPLRTQSFQLNYAKAADIAAQLRGEIPGGNNAGGSSFGGTGTGSNAALARMLTSRGSVIPEMRTNQLFVTDIPSRLTQAQELITKLDIPVRQVMIEARIVEANDTFGKSLGVRLGGADLRGVRGGEAGYGVGGGNRIAIGGSYNAITNTTTESVNATSQVPGSNFSVDAANAGIAMNTNSTSFVNMPASLPGAIASTFALSLFSPSANRFLNLEISALQADGKGQVVSSPRVITADQTKAAIEQGTEYPYQAATSSGATNVQFKKAVMKLEVTPQITPEGGIILDVEISKDSPGEILNGQRAINTKRIKTNVLVENGGTVVIGGIFESEETENVTKVPLLGDLPAVGALFRNKTRIANKKELLVFLTPKVVSERGALR